MLHDWNNLFSMTGSAGAQLIGLLFVVVTLGGTGLSTSQSVDGVRAFLTPTLVNFGSVIFQAVAVLALWPSDRAIGLILVLSGLAGVAYRIYGIRLERKLDFVTLHGLDWIPYDAVPILGNAGLIAGGAGLIAEKSFAPYAIASASALLLFAGIYGAWDFTLWIIKNRDKTTKATPERAPIEPPESAAVRISAVLKG
jgi:hypothetical protein